MVLIPQNGNDFEYWIGMFTMWISMSTVPKCAHQHSIPWWENWKLTEIFIACHFHVGFMWGTYWKFILFNQFSKTSYLYHVMGRELVGGCSLFVANFHLDFLTILLDLMSISIGAGIFFNLLHECASRSLSSRLYPKMVFSTKLEWRLGIHLRTTNHAFGFFLILGLNFSHILFG